MMIALARAGCLGRRPRPRPGPWRRLTGRLFMLVAYSVLLCLISCQLHWQLTPATETQVEEKKHIRQELDDAGIDSRVCVCR